MGCDIHAFAEQKKDGKWIQIKRAFRHETHKGETLFTSEVYDGRDYELFAFLADVRNDDGIKPIAPPKGIPEDASHGYLAETEIYEGDGHSHSHFTLKELKSIPLELINQKIFDTSLILAKDEQGNITEVCGGTNGKHMGQVGERQLFKLWKKDKNPIEEIIDALESVKEYEDDDEIRIVFFFDN